MSSGTDLAYGTDGLRRGAADLTDVAATTEQARGVLRGAAVAPGMFGLTAGGAVYAAVLEAVRGVRAAGLEQETRRADDLGGRAQTAGDLGDALTDRTARVARAPGAG